MNKKVYIHSENKKELLKYNSLEELDMQNIEN